MNRRAKRILRVARRPLEWLGVGLGWLVFAHLSHRALFAACDFAGAVMYACDRRGRRLALENLRIVQGRPTEGPAPATRREKLVIRRSYRNMARTVGHVFWTSRRAAERAAAAGEFDERTDELLARHRPLVTVSAHLGCWEILSQLVALRGRRMMSVAKDVGSPGMTDLLMKARKSIGQEIVRADGAFRPLMRGIAEGCDLGLLVDQVVKPRNGGVWVRFFGRPMPVSAAPAFFAAKARVPIVVAWSRPLKDGRYRCTFVDFVEVGETRDAWGCTQRCLAGLERVIRRHPSCWILAYRYFRKTPTADELAQLEKRETRARGVR